MPHPTDVNKPFAVVLYITDQQGKILATTRRNNVNITRVSKNIHKLV